MFRLYVLCVPLILTTNVFSKTEKEIREQMTREVAASMKARYDNAMLTCPEDRPAYECSGIMIRGVNLKQQLPHAWSMKPLNLEKGSFSVSFLRRDQPFTTFPSRHYNSGFILQPHSRIPEGKIRYVAYCAFPIDAESDKRDDRGCGKHADDLMGTSDSCHRQGVHTFEKWVKHFQSFTNEQDFVNEQCSFDLSAGAPQATENFALCIRAKRYLQQYEKYAVRNNELKIQAWTETEACDIPFEAFFYVLDSADGLERAKVYRSDYLATCGTWIPVVGICLPHSVKGDLCDQSFEPYID